MARCSATAPRSSTPPSRRRPSTRKSPSRPTVGSTIPEGTSLFDVGEPEPEPEAPPVEEGALAPVTKPAEPARDTVGSTIPEGQSLFDIGEPEPDAPDQPEPPPVEPVETKPAEQSSWNVGDDIPEGQSLFDVGRVDPVAAQPAATAAASDDPETILDADDEPRARARARGDPSPHPAAPPHRREHQRRGVALRLVTRTDAVRRRNHVRWGHKSGFPRSTGEIPTPVPSDTVADLDKHP